MRELIERNELEIDQFVDCIFTDHHRPQRRVPGARRAAHRLRARAAAVHPRDRRARLAADGDPRARPLLRADRPRRPPRVPRRGPQPARGPRCRTIGRWRSSSRPRSSGSRPTRRRAATARRATSRSSRATSRPTRRSPEVVAAAAAAVADVNRYPDPTSCAAAQRAERPLRRAGRADRGRQRLLRRAADAGRGAARAGRRARLRLAVVLGLPAARGGLRRARDPRARSTRDERHDLDAMARRDHRRDAAGDRLQPQQPDEHGAAARADRRVRRQRSRRTSAC